MLAEKYRGKVDAVAGLESRGFILAAPLAVALGVGMLTVRKLAVCLIQLLELTMIWNMAPHEWSFNHLQLKTVSES